MGKRRLRNKEISFRVTEYEHRRIMEQFSASGKLTLREYMTAAAINTYIINVEHKEIKELSYEINRIGNNINQIAHKVNVDDRVSLAQIRELQEDMDMIWRLLRKNFYQIK